MLQGYPVWLYRCYKPILYVTEMLQAYPVCYRDVTRLAGMVDLSKVPERDQRVPLGANQQTDRQERQQLGLQEDSL